MPLEDLPSPPARELSPPPAASSPSPTAKDAGKEAPPVRFDGELNTAMLRWEDAMAGGTVVAPRWRGPSRGHGLEGAREPDAHA